MPGDPPMAFEIPNLDCLSENDLIDLEPVMRELAEYCKYKSAAMRWRKEGYVGQARAYEDTCDRIYKNLPEWAKW